MKFLKGALIAIVIFSFFEKLILLPSGLSTYTVMKLAIPLILLATAVIYKKNFKKFLFYPINTIFLGLILAILVSAIFSSDPNSGFRETLNYLMIFSLSLIFSINNSVKRTHTYLNIYFVLVLISIISRIIFLIWPELYQLIILNHLESYALNNFLYHVYNQKQFMFLDATSIVFPIFILGIGKIQNHWIRILLFFVIIGSLLLTNSRTYIAGAIIFFVLHQILFKDKDRFINWKWIVTIFTVGTILSSFLVGQNIVSRYVFTMTGDLQQLSGRVALGQQAVFLANQKPLTGIGPRQFATETPKENLWNIGFENYLNQHTQPTEQAAPTAYSILNLAAESGYVALFLQLALWIAFFVQDVRKYKTLSSGDKMIFFHLAFAFYMILFPSLIDTPTPSEYFSAFIIRGMVNGIDNG